MSENEKRFQIGTVSHFFLHGIVDELLKDIMSRTPRVGESYIRGILRSRVLHVQRWRVRERLQSLDPVGRATRSLAIQRRVYNVSAPNCLWHMDTNHKLIN